ncbi:MAG: transglycosylase domain-containing protein, partial [Geobacteraceae bacterium]|nr:transglycosylase domain-containing protein [Geobacteraceae bacterium]
IGQGAHYYFGKPASSLTPRECAFLAAMLPGPRLAYNQYRNLQKVVRRSDMILRLLRRKGVLSETEYRIALAQEPNITGMQRKVEESIQKQELFENVSSAVSTELSKEGNPQTPGEPAREESPDTGAPAGVAHPPTEGTIQQPEKSPANPSPPAGERTE